MSQAYEHAVTRALRIARGQNGGLKPIGHKINRDAFLYFDPKPPENSFAQCGTCILFTGNACFIHGPKVKITKNMTCCLYVHGKPRMELKGKEEACVTPNESGLADYQVRCENCEYGGQHCKLYGMLNQQMPDIFELNTKINSKGCCNAFTRKT